MANNSYLRSVNKERELVNDARTRGMIAARSAGSHSPVDVWCVDHKNKEVVCTQVKVKKGCGLPVRKDVKIYPGYTVIFRTMSWERRNAKT